MGSKESFLFFRLKSANPKILTVISDCCCPSYKNLSVYTRNGHIQNILFCDFLGITESWGAAQTYLQPKQISIIGNCAEGSELAI